MTPLGEGRQVVGISPREADAPSADGLSSSSRRCGGDQDGRGDAVEVCDPRVAALVGGATTAATMRGVAIQGAECTRQCRIHAIHVFPPLLASNPPEEVK